MTATITRPGDTHTATHGRLTLHASIGVDGARGINVFQGPTRVDALCFTVTDADDARAIYRAIGNGALAGKSVEAIADDVRAVLVHRMNRINTRPGHGRRVAELDRAVDRLDRAGTDRPRTFADLRNAHAAAVTRDRAARLVVA